MLEEEVLSLGILGKSTGENKEDETKICFLYKLFTEKNCIRRGDAFRLRNIPKIYLSVQRIIKKERMKDSISSSRFY